MSIALGIGRISGIRIAIHASWLLVFALVTWSVATELADFGEIPAVLAGALYALALFASIIAHEVAHALCARMFGVQTRVITLFAFGGIATLEDEPPTPVAEVLIALAGPLASFVLGGLWLGASWALRALDPSAATPATAAAELLALANVLVGVFNLIPAYPMDGGRVLRALLWRASGNRSAATSTASLCGVGFGAALGALGLVMLATTRDWRFLWYVLLSGFLVRMTWQTYADARRLVQRERLHGTLALRAGGALP